MINKAADKVTWVTFTDGVKSALKFASFNQLCNDSGHEFKRLEIGYLIAEFCDRDAQNVMDSIGHPIEAWNAADPQRKEADSWRHWALVHRMSLGQACRHAGNSFRFSSRSSSCFF